MRGSGDESYGDSVKEEKMIFANMSFMARFLAACDNIFVKGVVLAIAMDTFLGCLRAAKYHKWNRIRI